MSKKCTCKKGKRLKGGVVLNLDEGIALQIKSGKLFVCKCSSWEFGCETIGGDTYCSTACKSWSCKEIKPGKPAIKAIINELSKE